FSGRTMCSSGVSASVTATDLPSMAIEGAACRSAWRAQFRSWASVVPFPSNVLHSNEDAVTKILVPGFTVHDLTPLGPNGATVPPRLRHANAAPPLPNGFCGLGVWSTIVHNAARSAPSLLVGTA